jgi:mRNA interferase HicA
MNSEQMKKWLEQQGATFLPGKGSHLKVFLKGRQSALPMHGTAELAEIGYQALRPPSNASLD